MANVIGEFRTGQGAEQPSMNILPCQDASLLELDTEEAASAGQGNGPKAFGI